MAVQTPDEFDDSLERALREVLEGRRVAGAWTAAALTREGAYPETSFIVTFRAPSWSDWLDRRFTYRPWHGSRDPRGCGDPKLLAWMLHDNCIEYFDTEDLQADQVDVEGGIVEMFPDDYAE